MEEIRECKKHGLCLYRKDSSGHWRCTKCRSEAVQKRRARTKELAVEYKGGKCQICGYSKYLGALEFHHLDSNQKDFGIGEKGHTRGFSSIKQELDKCICVCSNCHKEIHAGLITL